ncbi:MAG TPA: hypothetical protein ENK23_03335 [Sorangium sp.]|nr:hypothetical protein [Sorangium sp.]
MSRVSLRDLHIEDEAAFRHVGWYGDLKAVMARPPQAFAVLEGEASRPGDARLLNLAFWQPGDVAEVLCEPVISADQLMHSAWHVLGCNALGAAARTALGLLLVESVASAFDIYLVGRVLGHCPDALFLQTQVPAMADAAEEAGLSDDGFAALLQRAADEPEECFEQLQQLLFSVASQLLEARDVDAAKAVLLAHRRATFAPLLHHYELVTWVLYARCYGAGGSAAAVAQSAAALAEGHALKWLRHHWLNKQC